MKSYFKFLSRNKLYTAIEAFGLSVALGFVIILASYARMEYNVGKDIKAAKDIYAVGMGNCLGMTWGTPQEFFPSIPEIKQWTRFAEVYGVRGIMAGNRYIKANAYAIDTNFFQMFDYELRGCPRDRVLTDEKQVIVSESFAAKAFGNETPVGKILNIDTGHESGIQQFTVTGVMQDFGSGDFFKPCDIMLSMKHKEKILSRMDNFGEVIPFVRLAKGADSEKVAANLLDKYVAYWDFYQREGEFLWGSTLTRLDKLYFYDGNSWMFRHGNKIFVDIMFIVVLVLLLSAILNYINLTVAQAGKRAKEMATRRLLGESIMGVVMRYFRESAVFTTFCFLIGLLLAYAMIPAFCDILDAEISIPLSVGVVCCTVAAIILISLVCGIVPAVVVSRFSPIDVVKGSLRMKSKMWFSKMFIVAQGVVSTVLIAVGMVMALQMHHLATLPVGFNTKDLIVASTIEIGTDYDRQNILVERLKALPEVEEAVPTGGTPLLCGNNAVHDGEETMGWLRMSRLDSTAMNMLGIKVLEQYCAPSENKLWITESGKRYFKVSAENQNIGRMKDGKPNYECCGVISDFISGGALATEMDNTYNAVMVPAHDGYYYTTLIKTRGDHDNALAAIRKTYSEVAKELTGMPLDFEGKYIDDSLADDLKEKRNTMMLVLTFMLVSVLISALGMFAMSVYYSEQQRRQIALRKVMGATTANAVWTLSRRFVVMTAVAIVIALPISIKIATRYLQDFVHRIDFPWWTIPAAAAFTLVIAFASVISRTLRVATGNPVDSIKTE